MQNKATQLRRSLLARDVRELLACVIVGVVFGIYFFIFRAPIMRLGSLITVAGSIFIAWKILHARRATPPAKPDATVVESLRAELHSVRTQSRLLRSVLWWYLLPLTVGTLVFVWGMPSDDLGFKIGFSLFTLALDVFIYWLNQWARAKQLLPVEAQLQSLLHSAETGQPLDETHVASLRPIALSMAAADQSKPIEFEVSFWLMAFYGEIGFVGMWFFGALALTEFNISKIFNWHYFIWIVPFFLGGLVYSWLLQKLTKRAVGISPLGIHLHKGRTLILWDEIKEIRTFRTLNICSLRLIRESGERTIMPWTSLKRRADLAAAVEKFAPANHPIRNHLPLIMKTQIRLVLFVLVLMAAIIAVAAQQVIKTNAPANSIEAICKKHKVPALAVVVTRDGQICDRAAAGVRKWGDPTPVTTNDLFHIGSCTKSMTATVAAMLIEEGKLRWDTTIAEVFPELKGKMDKRYEAVTVEQLLHHRGGVPHEPPPAAWARAWQEIGTPAQQRREFIEAFLREPPAAAPGEKEIYSNQGYAIVGAMLEKISGQDFESLMSEKLFKPLHMDTAGFGVPNTKDKVDQPWGHTRKLFMTIPEQIDNPPAITPAGRVHCSLDDLARYAMFHLQEHATNGLLKPETLARLHKPDGSNISSPVENYACGWVVLKRGWAGGRALWHNGSNTMWYIVMWLAPEKNFCVIAATNVAGDDAEQACDDAAVMMIDKWLPK